MKMITCVFVLLLASSYHQALAESFTCQKDGIFANPEDCSTYYMCAGLKPTLQHCAPPTLFDSTINNCNFPEKVKCEGSPSSIAPTPDSTTSTSEIPTTATSPPSPQTSTQTTWTPPETTTTTTAPPLTSSARPAPHCPETGHQNIPDPENCKSYYVCIEGQYNLEACPPGYGFNSVYQDCTKEDNDCEIGGSHSTTPPPGAPTCPPTEEIRLPNPTDCNSYYICLNGVAYVITCPVNYQFDASAGVCAEAMSSTCGDFVTPSPEDKMCSERPDGSLLPNPTDCSKFYTCSHGDAIPKSCPDGLQFSVDKNSCAAPNQANCHVQ